MSDREEAIRKIREYRTKEYLNKRTKCLQQLRQELYDKCISLGGHFFGEPQQHLVPMLIGYSYNTTRLCWGCHYEEVIEEKRVLPPDWDLEDEEENNNQD